jgi:hypothetical protein
MWKSLQKICRKDEITNKEILKGMTEESQEMKLIQNGK